MTDTYWNQAHKDKYSKSDWGSKPTLFAEAVSKYFPVTGRLLDIGTGQGQDANYFASLGYTVTATDFSDSALESAKQHISNVTFLKADTAQGLPFEDNSFDVVYSHLALHYFDDATTKKVFKDISRVLKPGGIFATITNTIEDPEVGEDGYKELERGFYKTPAGIVKRYFSIAYMTEVTQGLFETILLDANGETYKDEIKTLIRFIGKAVK